MLMPPADSTYINSACRAVMVDNTTAEARQCVPRFPPTTWNVHQLMPNDFFGDQTYNSAEVWNRRFKCILGHNLERHRDAAGGCCGGCNQSRETLEWQSVTEVSPSTDRNVAAIPGKALPRACQQRAQHGELFACCSVPDPLSVVDCMYFLSHGTF